MRFLEPFPEFIPTSEIETEIGQSVVDAMAKKRFCIVGLTGKTVAVAFEKAVKDGDMAAGVRSFKKANLHWVGTHWVHLPRPWILTVEEWDGKTFIAQFHDTQAEMLVEASSEKDAVLKFPNRGHVTIFKLRRMLIRLDSAALVNGLMFDLSEKGPFGSTLDLMMSQPTLRETLSPKIKNTLIDQLERAWNTAVPEGIWWAVGGQGETWCSGCSSHLLMCSCEDFA